MSVKFYVSSSVRCVNEIDIRDTNSCIIRAILFPESPSAFRRCQLIKGEKSVPIQVRVQKPEWIGGAISRANSGLRRIRVRGTSHTNRNSKNLNDGRASYG